MNEHGMNGAAGEAHPREEGRPLLFRNARIIDPAAGREIRGDLLVREGRIAAIGQAIAPPEGAATIDCAGACLAPGIIDVGVKVGEPGERHKESYRTASAAAAAGGVTTIVTRPDTAQPIDTPETLEFVRRRAAEVAQIRIHPMAALTRRREGREMSEIGLLMDAGAVAFTDGDHVVEDTKVLARCLTYAAMMGAKVIGHVQDPGLSRGAAATAGKFAALKGLPAVPAMAERMGLMRDLALVELTGADWHADQVTTRSALAVLARAKEAGLAVTAGCSIHHLTLNEFDIGDYRTFFKLKPPLRAEEDRVAAVEAVASGLIDIIASMHTPQDEESKRLPFEEAASGAVGLETLLPAALRLVHGGQLDLPRLFRALSLRPAEIFGLEGGRMQRGAPADLVLFDPDRPFILDRFALHSKSKNTPFDGARMEGRVLGTWVGGRQIFPAGDG